MKIPVGASKENPAVTVVDLNEVVDFNNVSLIRTVFEDMIDEYGDEQPKLVINLKNTSELRSAGMRELVVAKRLAKMHNGNLVLAEPSEEANESLNRAGIKDIMGTFVTESAAVAFLSGLAQQNSEEAI
jgi:anti-anti-sigma factor